MDCYKLKKIALPSTITEIGDYSFYTCFDIDTLIIPEGTTTIGSYAFQYCLSMEVIELPSTITMIDDYAFADCHNLKKVTATMNNPCAINENVFGLIYWEDEEAVIKPSKAALCVPKGLAGIYRESDGWSSFAVIAEPVIVTAQNYTIQYGDDIPAFNYTSEGVELNGTPRIICTATKSSPAGTYPIVITKGSVTNYNDTYIDGTLTITKAPLTITVNSLSIWQDDAFPVFNVTYQGFKNGEDSTVLTRLPVVTSDVTSTNIIGEYNITASGAKAKNYKISYIQGKLTIKERIPGDVTGNGSVDIQDATIAVNYILGEHSKKYAYYMADLNKDSLIDVFDITAIINVIFKRSNFMAPVRSSNRERGTSYNLSNYSSVTPSNRLDMIYLSSVPNTVSLGVDKSERFTSFQMDVETPKNAEILAVELTGSKETHIIQAEKISNDIFRVIALSMNNTPLADTNNEIVSLKFANTTSGEVTVHNVIFVTPDGDAYHLNGSGTTTLPITNDIDIEIIYDLYGRQIFKRSKDLDNGVYIINNKKVVIK